MEPANTYSEERLLYLLKGHINRNLTAPEATELEQWRLASKDNQQLLNDMSNAEFRIQELKRQQVYNVESALIRVKKLTHSKRALPLWPKLVAAASILFIIGILFKVYVYQGNVNVIGSKTAANINQGNNKATLTLANGKRISLTDATNGELAKEAGITISKTASGQLIYTVLDPGNSQDDKAERFNTIEIPRGDQRQVRLPDGSEVWLNADSKLILPVPLMVRGKREVTLIGEAYFEVAKDKAHPFIVKSAGQSVEVLGTHFNINAYSDEPNIKTTLLEGSVLVSLPSSSLSSPSLLSNPSFPSTPSSLSNPSLRGGTTKQPHTSKEVASSLRFPRNDGVNDIVLKPGQQATLMSSKIQVENVDTEEAIAWKNGYFNLNNETTEGIMRQLSKWYDIEVAFKGNLPIRKFEGEIPRNNSLSETLKILETANIHFIVEGKKITVIP